jgi:sugar fermentation stimulation protein A
VPAPWYSTEPLIRSRFVRRDNRFVVTHRQGGTTATAYLSNSGRLGEILVDGVDVLLAERPKSRHHHEVLAAGWTARFAGDTPRVVMLNSGRINRVVETMIERGLVRELAGYRLIKREPAWGHGRFDFLLADRGGAELLLEVKSVTLVEHGVAMFPDAASERGTRHLGALLAAADPPRRRTAVLFLVQGDADRFAPDVHNDPAFGRALLAARERVEIWPMALTPELTAEQRLVFAGPPRPLALPWSAIERASADAGCIGLLAHIEGGGARAAGAAAMGQGVWFGIEAAPKDLAQELRRTLAPRRQPRSHLAQLGAAASRSRGFALRGVGSPCSVAAAMAGAGPRRIALAGETCCPGHAIGFATWPEATATFQRALTALRAAPFG